MGYGQNDDARRYEEQRRADEARRYDEQRRQELARQDEARRDEQRRYERQKADDDRRYYERKQENERRNREFADRKSDENAAADDRFRQAQARADREHQESEDAYHESLKQKQDQFREQERAGFEAEQRERQSANATGHPWVDDPAFAGLFKFGLFCLVVWALWAGLQKFWLFTHQWQTHDIPLRWVGQFYRTLFDVPQNTIFNFFAANMDFVVKFAESQMWIIGAGFIAVIVVLMILGMLVTSKLARRLFGIGALVFVAPALLGGLWLLLPPESAVSARAWIKAQPFYTAQVNGAEIDASVVALSDWLACSTYQLPAFPVIAVNTLVRGKVLVPLSAKATAPADQESRLSVYKPFTADFSLAGQIVREVRVIEGSKATAIEVDFIGKPIRVAAVNTQYLRPVAFYPDGPTGEKFAYTDGHSGYRESPRGRVVGYENVLRADKSGFTVRCPV